MGRPLKQDVIEKMGLVASGKELSKQVGYNKYKVKDSEDEIVRLAEVEDLDKGDVVLSATIGNGVYTVLKLMKHLIQTTEGAFEYTLDEEGKALDKDGNEISFGGEPTPPAPTEYTFTITKVMTADTSEDITSACTIMINDAVRSSITIAASEAESTPVNWVVEPSDATYEVKQGPNDLHLSSDMSIVVTVEKIQQNNNSEEPEQNGTGE